MSEPYGYRWEYSPLAHLGNKVWERAVSPALELFAADELKFFRRMRGVIQITVLVAALLIPASLFWHPGRLFTASGLLFDIAGVLRLFLFDELKEALSGFKANKYGNLPSVATRELLMPEASGPYTAEHPPIKIFYYKKRGVLFLFVGFLLQMIGDLSS
jgi:hypothetical protein